jgi:hypothetical protein
MKISRKKLLTFLAGMLTVSVLAGIAYAGFGDKGKVLGSSFSVGNADIKLFMDPSQGTDQSNLADEITGPSFTNIGQSWQEDYQVKIYNNGTYRMALTSNANYETVNDPDDLRQYIYAEIFTWTDTNNDGLLTDGELGTSIGKKTIIKWKTEGFSLGEFNSGDTLGFVIRFSTDSISDTKQGTQAIFDFEFNSIEL